MKPSTTKETPKGKTPSKGSKISKSASTQEAVEEPIVEVVMDEAGEDVPHGDDQTQDISDPKTRKSLNPDWFKQPPRPSTPDPKWKKRQIENLTQDILLGPAFNQLKGTRSSSIELEFNFYECFNALTDKLDWNNLEGDRYLFDLSKSLPLQGPLGHRTIAAEYLFNNDLKYLKTSNLETYPDIKCKEPYTPSYYPPGIVYEDLNKQKRVMQADELYIFSDGTLKSVRDDMYHRVLNFCLDYNMEIPTRKWTAVDQRRSGLMIELIDKQLREREIIKNLE
nr:hypothetical protein [Tanacetum cinerariifolium]